AGSRSPRAWRSLNGSGGLLVPKLCLGTRNCEALLRVSTRQNPMSLPSLSPDEAELQGGAVPSRQHFARMVVSPYGSSKRGSKALVAPRFRRRATGTQPPHPESACSTNTYHHPCKMLRAWERGTGQSSLIFTRSFLPSRRMLASMLSPSFCPRRKNM